MRAIKSGELLGFRDNKNQWRITYNDLEAWRSAQSAHTVEEDVYAHPVHTNAQPVSMHPDTLELARMKTELEAEKTLRMTVETDRDHWRALAQKLAEPRPRRWWFGKF